MYKILAVAAAFFVVSVGYWMWIQTNPETADIEQDEGMNEQLPEQTGGDAAGGTQLATPEVEDQLVGEWRSTGDVQFTRIFRADGTITDTYAGEEVMTEDAGTWEVLSDLRGEPISIPSEEGVNYLKLMFGTEAMYFSIAELDAESLVMIYLNRGGALEFERVR